MAIIPNHRKKCNAAPCPGRRGAAAFFNLQSHENTRFSAFLQRLTFQGAAGMITRITTPLGEGKTDAARGGNPLDHGRSSGGAGLCRYGQLRGLPIWRRGGCAGPKNLRGISGRRSDPFHEEPHAALSRLLPAPRSAWPANPDFQRSDGVRVAFARENG